jgi:hypothetical protein
MRMAIVKNIKELPRVKLSEYVAANTLALKFDWARNIVFPNVYMCGGEIDLAVITPAGYLWEFEIKLTLADWKADANKSKWSHPSRKYISRFYYAVPEGMAEKVPDFVPESTGLIELYYNRRRGDWLTNEVRKATGKRGEKVPDISIKKIKEKAYFRYWGQRWHKPESKRMEYDGSLEDL